MPSRAKPEPGKKVVALTGASNYLGLGVMRSLLQDENISRLIAIDTKKPKLEHQKLVFYKVDLTNPSSQQIISKIFQNESVDTCVHLIFSYTLSRNPGLAHELEAVGTMHLLDACYEAGVSRIVARSTTAIYGAAKGNPNFLTEQHQVLERKGSGFINDKIELERQMRQYGREHPECSVAILRDCTSLGKTSINYLSSLLLAKHSPRVLGFDPLVQFIHEEDLFRAYKMVIMNKVQGTFNIVGKGVVRYSKAIKLLHGSELVLPESMLRAGTSILWGLKIYDIPVAFMNHIKYSWVADGTKAVKVLGFVPKYDCFEALKTTYQTRKVKAV